MLTWHVPVAQFVDRMAEIFHNRDRELDLACFLLFGFLLLALFRFVCIKNNRKQVHANEPAREPIPKTRFAENAGESCLDPCPGVPKVELEYANVNETEGSSPGKRNVQSTCKAKRAMYNSVTLI